MVAFDEPPLRPSISQEALRRNTALHVRARSALEKVLTVCAREGIDALPVKGIVTAYQLYDHISERRISDVDLRVAPADVLRILIVACREGWQLRQYWPEAGVVDFFVERISIDVKSTIDTPGCWPLGIQEMIARADRLQSPDGAIRLRPELYDHALLLCENVLKDMCEGAHEWALDDVERIVRLPNFEIGLFLERARAARVRGLVWIVAQWMATERSSEAWREIRDRIGASPRPFYTRLFFCSLQRKKSSATRRYLSRCVSDNASDWARVIWTGSKKAFDS